MFNIIGAGLAGSMLAKNLDNQKIPYRIFDNNLPYSASIISENLFSETWLKDVKYIKKSLDFIYDNYSVEVRSFQSNKGEKKLHHIPIPEILNSQYINEKVIECNKEGCLTENNFYKGFNIVCAGLMSKKLFNLPYLDALTGHGFFIKKINTKDFINTYRPYTHEKIMNWHNNKIWYGDSTAIKHSNYLKNKKKLIQNSLKRLKKYNLQVEKIVYGARPMNKLEPRKGLLIKINKNNIVMTGGWKDGLVIYPYLINKLNRWIIEL